MSALFDFVVKQLSDVSNTVGKLGKTVAAIEYEKKHKHRKCYKCGKYGHIAEHCGKICRYCKVQHGFEFCIVEAVRTLKKNILFLAKVSRKVDGDLQQGSLKTISKIYEGYIKEVNYKNEQAQAAKRAIAAAVSKLKLEQARFSSIMADVVAKSNGKVKAILEADQKSKNMAMLAARKYEDAESDVYRANRAIQSIEPLANREYYTGKWSEKRTVKFTEITPCEHHHIDSRYPASKLIDYINEGRGEVVESIDKCSLCYKNALTVLYEQIKRKRTYQTQLEQNKYDFSERLVESIKMNFSNVIKAGLNKINDVTYLIKDEKNKIQKKVVDRLCRKDLQKMKNKCKAFKEMKNNKRKELIERKKAKQSIINPDSKLELAQPEIVKNLTMLTSISRPLNPPKQDNRRVKSDETDHSTAIYAKGFSSKDIVLPKFSFGGKSQVSNASTDQSLIDNTYDLESFLKD